MNFPENTIKPEILSILCSIFLISTVGVVGQENQSVEQLAKTFCMTCHQVDKKLVGPSFVEMAGIYKDNPAGMVLWSLNPGKKRPETIQMPSMSFLGEEKLTQIAGYILKSAEGKTEQAVTASDKAAIPSLIEPARPKMQRIFMPEAGPAAIAVALPGELSYCWDATICRLRYVWKGQFIDPMPVYRGNGNGLAKIMGKVVFHTGGPESGIFRENGTPQFLGYRFIDGLPEFRYRIGGMHVSELLVPGQGDKTITQILTIAGLEKELTLHLPETTEAPVEVTGGKRAGSQLIVQPSAINVVTITTSLE